MLFLNLFLTFNGRNSSGPLPMLLCLLNVVSANMETSSFLADGTATQYDRLLASSCCPSVCLSVCPSLCDAVHCGSQGWCTGLKVAPACS